MPLVSTGVWLDDFPVATRARAQQLPLPRTMYSERQILFLTDTDFFIDVQNTPVPRRVQRVPVVGFESLELAIQPQDQYQAGTDAQLAFGPRYAVHYAARDFPETFDTHYPNEPRPIQWDFQSSAPTRRQPIGFIQRTSFDLAIYEALAPPGENAWWTAAVSPRVQTCHPIARSSHDTPVYPPFDTTWVPAQIVGVTQTRRAARLLPSSYADAVGMPG